MRVEGVEREGGGVGEAGVRGISRDGRSRKGNVSPYFEFLLLKEE